MNQARKSKRSLTLDLMFEIKPAGGDDLEKAKQLLLYCGLLTEGVEDHFLNSYFLANYRSDMIGICGVEVYNAFGLLRSVAVAPKWRGRSVGDALVENSIAWAKGKTLQALYLLTIDADQYFERHGFSRLSRNEVPLEIKSSLEFTSLCPETAIVMVKSLGRRTGRT
jgi:amino-acid N-acetyltransferase